MANKLRGDGPISKAINEHEDRLGRLDPGGGDSRLRYTSGPRGTVIEGQPRSRTSARITPASSTVPRYI